MISSRIKDPNLAAQIDEGQLTWYRYITPITEQYCRQIASQNYRGKRLAYWGHITMQNTILMMLVLKQTGVEIVMGACNVDSTNDIAAAYAVSKGITVFGWQGMSQLDYQKNLALIRSFEADYLCDTGGEMIVAYLDKTPPVKGALEATTSGINLLKKYKLPFPVFDWNRIPSKNHLENRYHVGDSIWPVFSYITGMGLFGKRVFVIGYGPVGKGIAERARNLGAIVSVFDVNSIRLLEASHHGCEMVTLEEGLDRSQIIVTATGVEGVLSKEQLYQVRRGAILFNAGHSNREIDIDWLYDQPHQKMKAHIEQFTIGGKYLFLLAKGSLLNLATGTDSPGVDLFDHYTAVMLLGITWMFDGMPDNILPGLKMYPAHLEKKIAKLSIDIYSKGLRPSKNNVLRKF
ncbi:MAG: adenosylhomocysteinase [Actinobacteria bacterium]|nr:adenosylhomocysteinase [Actinomycetota bacterium]